MRAGRGLTIGRMVKLAQVSRASYYRFDENAESGVDSDMDLRDAIQRVALEWPSYGRRRITRELRRRGWTVNWKRVYRLMREAGSPLGAAVCAEAEVRSDDRFQSWAESLPQPGAADGADRCRSALAG